ncbi:hypothetical protein [Candidatus Binatus sp.]|uniref:hypothetical protein n=1 Tax=Candidatus Binatus sp. TaxID=2811406 RepID=UPI003CC5D77A
MKLFKSLFIASALIFIAAYPCKAEDIPFQYCNSDPAQADYCITCFGPYLRQAGPDYMINGCQTFYAADVTIFPPYGNWTCYTSPLCPLPQSTVTDTTTFCLPSSTDQVNLTVSATVPHFSSDQPTTCDESATHATLGDNATGDFDADTFTFQGTSGDTVTLTLEPDSHSGSIGTRANLTMARATKGQVVGGTTMVIRKISAGILPITLTAILPGAGTYTIEVSQSGIAKNVRFRGGYLLSLHSSLGNTPQFMPTDNVEF